MSNQQLSDYVRQQFQQGKSKDEIKSELLGAGWQEADINQALGMSGSSQPPRPPVPPSAPSFTSSGQQQLDPKAVWLFFLRSIFVFLFISIWIGFGFIATLTESSESSVLGIVLVIFLVVLVFSFIWAKLTYHFYRYELTEEGFRKELGVIFKKYVTIPYDRIQNVDIYRGILARILGLSDLNIQTAGMSASVGRFGVSGAGAEGRLPALSREVAEEVRNELIRRARQTKNQGL
ncbi:PH domain-containing protein [Patescibacteria group bacterium]|nr:PH domain-containing protein [Patescibacteria group bacterium]